MIQIILTPEQEQFIEKQLKTGQYKDIQDVLSKAFQLLEEKEDEIVLPSYVKGTESAKELLKEKIRKYRAEREKNKGSTELDM